MINSAPLEYFHFQKWKEASRSWPEKKDKNCHIMKLLSSSDSSCNTHFIHNTHTLLTFKIIFVLELVNLPHNVITGNGNKFLLLIKMTSSLHFSNCLAHIKDKAGIYKLIKQSNCSRNITKNLKYGIKCNRF